MRRGALLVAAVLAAALCLASPARAGVPVVVIDGKGWGHGVGLSQYGAMYLAEAGLTTEQILGTFYPGTVLATADGAVRVSVFTSSDNAAVVQFPSGGQLTSQAEGFPVNIGPGGAVQITWDGTEYHVTGIVTGQAEGRAQAFTVRDDNCVPLVNCPPAGGGGCLLCTTTTVPPKPPPDDTTTTTAPDSTTGSTAPPVPSGLSSTAPITAIPVTNGVTSLPARGRSYRGTVTATAGTGVLRLVNDVDLQTYLKGMGEMPGNWPAPAVQAQAIASRTYVLRAMAAGGEICDDDRCQYYVGATRETAGQSAAVDATNGKVLVYGGKLAAAMYSADAGGQTATPFEAWGTPEGTYPYLSSVHYDTPNPLPWEVTIALSDVASRFGYSGTITNIAVSATGPSGRATAVDIEGTAGTKQVSGPEFDRQLGLRSTLLSIRITTSDAPPPAPAPVDEWAQMAQVLPEQSASVATSSTPTDLSTDGYGNGVTVGPELKLRNQRHPITQQAGLWWAILVGTIVLTGATARTRAWVRTRNRRP